MPNPADHTGSPSRTTAAPMPGTLLADMKLETAFSICTRFSGERVFCWAAAPATVIRVRTSKYKTGTRNECAFVNRARCFKGAPRTASLTQRASAGNGGVGGVGDVLRASPPIKEKALTRVQAPPYNGEMKLRLYLAAVAILVSGALAGCEDAGKKPVQARVPALAPTATAAAQAPPELPVLPLANPAGRRPVWLLPPVPAGKEYLIQKVQEKFASGEQNFKAGHLEAARKDFDDAVDWMLESGYDPNGDPRLSELF